MALKLSDLLNLGTGITRGILGQRSAGAATDKIVGGIDAATATQKGAFDATKALYDPYLAAGQQGLTKLTDLALNPAQYTTPFAAPTAQSVMGDPGYAFGLAEGQKAMDRSAAARHGLVSGAALKAGDRYATDYATTKYNDAFNRSLQEYGINFDVFNKNADRAYQGASDLTGIGQGAVAGVAGASKTYSEQISALEQAKADALAIGDLAKAAELDDMIAGIGDTAGDLLGDKTVSGGIDKLGDLLGIGSGGGATVSTGQPSQVTSTIKNGITSGALPAAKTLGGLAAGLSGDVATGIVPGVTGMGAEGVVADSIMAGANATAPTTALAGPGAGGGAGGFSLGALAPLAPLAAAAIPAYFTIKNAQVHPTADLWVQSAQNPFDDAMEQVQDPAQKAELAKGYLAKLQDFMSKGGEKERIVGTQALETFRQYYGDPQQYGVTITLPKVSGLAGLVQQFKG